VGFPAGEVTTALDWEYLVLREDVLTQVQQIRNWLDHNDVMYGLGIRTKLKPGYRCLFHGAPGTGKTLRATLLGKYTGHCVFRVDRSMVTSKYVGETEKNLASLFNRAESQDQILFFDEADALYSEITDVKDSHDRYADQETSYVLQREEEFDGLVILASNLKASIDEAFLRRFNEVIS
jgi:SpoVK/Ycf46/Vps4 family AAA+-type ATPase